MDLVKVGKITTSFGVKGEVKVKSDSYCLTKKFKQNLYIYQQEKLVTLKIVQIKGTDDKKIVKFDIFDSLNDVEDLKNVDIFVEECHLPKLSEDEFYIKDLIGLPCYVGEEFISEVKNVRDYPQSYYLVLEVNGKSKLVPFLNEFVDVFEDRIIIKPIEGLL